MLNKPTSAMLQGLFAPEDDVLRQIQADAGSQGLPSISLSAEEGRLLQVLLKATNAQKVLEFGALGGYSGTWIARALPADGQLFTLEVSKKHAQAARAAYARAGVAERVTLVEGDARQTLKQMVHESPFDLVFMDADPENYPQYFRAVRSLLRLGGVLTVHNALEGVPGMGFDVRRSRGMMTFLNELARDTTFTSIVLPYGSGTLIAVKTEEGL